MRINIGLPISVKHILVILLVGLSISGWSQTIFSFSAENQSRYEYISDQFRAPDKVDDQIFVLRTHGLLGLSTGTLDFLLEAVDARQYDAREVTPLGTGIVNAMELLQANATIHFGDTSNQFSIQAGRMTLDLGKRRFVARNRFRNTINAFTGIRGVWENQKGSKLDAFFFLPVFRRPTDKTSLLENVVQADIQNFNATFWGLYYHQPDLFSSAIGEFFLFGLSEKDNEDFETEDRNFITLGTRIFKDAKKGASDFEIVSVYQNGKSRLSRSTDLTEDLDHSAFYQHLEFGYTFDAKWSPRAILQFDFATGDKDPNDDKNGRFDSLFGVPRFEYGPTSIYRAFIRENLASVGYRLSAKPDEKINLMLSHRFNWLASASDAWTSAGWHDPSGNSGSFVGSQVELNIRWDILPDHIRLEWGLVQLWGGAFYQNVADRESYNSTFFYFQSVLKI